MQKHEDVVQNLNGNVVALATIQVMVAFTNTPATIYSDPAAQAPIDLLRTDNLGQFGFYAPNGRYDIFAIINGNRVAHDTDVLLFDPEDDERITGGGSGGGGSSGGSGGTGTGMTPEVELQIVNGTIQPDYSIGNNFYVKLTSAAKFLNPINYPDGVDITLTVEQDSSAAYAPDYDTQYAMPDSQPIQIASLPGGINLFTMHHTKAGGGQWLTSATPDKSAAGGYGPVTAIARIGSVNYFGMGDVAGAMTLAKPGDTIVVLRNGKSHEVTGTIFGQDTAEVYRIYGNAVPANGDDQRPLLNLPSVDFEEGPPHGINRPAYGKALLNFEGKGTVYVRDLRITGARNDDSDARGICNNSDALNLVVNNVEITDCNNGIENGNATMTGNTTLTDVRIDRCGVGGHDASNSHGTGTSDGFTHSVYFGRNLSTITLKRVSMTNSVAGDNLKCRTWKLFGSQVLCSGANAGRELEVPNGGWVEMDNSTFWKTSNATSGSLVLVGGNGGTPNTDEGLYTTRARKYRFANCLFKSDYSMQGGGAGRDGYLICNLDPDVPLELVDCVFEGDAASNNSDDPNGQAIYAGTMTRNGIRYRPSAPPVITFTGGPVGPILTPGYQPVAMTPIVN